jgi:protein SCO1/2
MTSRRRGWLLLALLLGTPWMATAQTALERPFTLLDTNGRKISDKDLRGRWLLVFFGYTRCPDICPTTLGSIAAVLDQLGSVAIRVQPVFITVDPTRDTAEALRAYLALFDQRIIGLTGNAEQIARTAAVFGVRYFKVPGSDPQEYTMAHSALVYVIGPEGGIVTQFSNAHDPDDMARTLAALIK